MAQLRRESEGFFRKPEGFKRRSGRLLAEKRKASSEKAAEKRKASSKKAEGFFRGGYTYIPAYVRVVADYMYSAVPWLFSPSTSSSG